MKVIRNGLSEGRLRIAGRRQMGSSARAAMKFRLAAYVLALTAVARANAGEQKPDQAEAPAKIDFSNFLGNARTGNARTYVNDPEKSVVIAEFDVAAQRGALMVPVTVAGRKTWFVLDTGSSMTVLDASIYEQHLGEPPVRGMVMKDGVSDKRGRGNFYFRPGDFAVGSVKAAGPELVICMPLDKQRAASKKDFTGILGADFLRDKFFQIDLQKGKSRFLSGNPYHVSTTVRTDSVSSSTYIPPEEGRAIRLERTNHRYHHYSLDAFLPEVGGERMILDTGNASDSVMLKRELFDHLVRSGHIARLRDEKAVTLAGEVDSRSGSLDRITLEGTIIRDVRVGEGSVNAIGLGLLSRFLVTIDFPNGWMYLKPNARASLPDLVDCSGLSFEKNKGRVVVTHVTLDSPAARRGIRPKDVVLRINGGAAEGYTPFQLDEMLGQEEGVVQLTLRRGERTFDVALRLRDYHTHLPTPTPKHHLPAPTPEPNRENEPRDLKHPVDSFRGNLVFLGDKIVQYDFENEDDGKLLKEVPKDVRLPWRLQAVGDLRFPGLTVVPSPSDSPDTDAVFDARNNGSSLALRPELFDRLVKTGHITRVKQVKAATATTAGGVGRQIGFLDQVWIGNATSVWHRAFDVRGVTVREARESAIGLGLLARFRITIDFPNKQIYLKPNKWINEPDAMECSGLSLLSKEADGSVSVLAVDRTSPAAEEGIRPMDTILRVDGKPAGDYSLFQIRKLLSREGKQVRLTLRRGEKTFDVTLDLRDYGTYLPPPKPQQKSTKPAFRPLPLP